MIEDKFSNMRHKGFVKIITFSVIIFVDDSKEGEYNGNSQIWK